MFNWRHKTVPCALLAVKMYGEAEVQPYTFLMSAQVGISPQVHALTSSYCVPVGYKVDNI